MGASSSTNKLPSDATAVPHSDQSNSDVDSADRITTRFGAARSGESSIMRVDASAMCTSHSVAAAEVRILGASYQFLVIASAMLSYSQNMGGPVTGPGGNIDELLAKLSDGDGCICLHPDCVELALVLEQIFASQSGQEGGILPFEPSENVLQQAAVGPSSRFQAFVTAYSEYKGAPLGTACQAAMAGQGVSRFDMDTVHRCAQELGLKAALVPALQSLLKRYSAVDGTVTPLALEEIASASAAGALTGE